MDWNQIILTILGSVFSAGGIGTIIMLKENKRAKQLENKAKEDSIERERMNSLIDEWKEIAEERLERLKDERSNIVELRRRIDERDEKISDLRTKIDEKNTECAVATILKCTRQSCEKRLPPLGYSENHVEDTFKTID